MDNKGIPPDAYPVEQYGTVNAGMTAFDKTTAAHIQATEIRGETGEDILSLSITVVKPKGGKQIGLAAIDFGVVNSTQPQISVTIQTMDGSPISDGYMCHYSFVSAVRGSK